MSCEGRIQTFLEALASALYVENGQVFCNIQRTTAGDSWSSTNSGQLPLILEVDFHYPIDTIGSRTSSSK